MVSVYKVPVHVPKGVAKCRMRFARPELEFIFVAVLNRLVWLNKLISEYEKLKKHYEKELEYVTQFPEPRQEVHRSFDKDVARLRKLEPKIQPKNLRYMLRLYDKVWAALGKPTLNPEFTLVRDDVAEWVHHPFFVNLPKESETS